MNHHLETLMLDPDDPCLVQLAPRHRSILICRKTMTLQQVADQEGVSTTRIRQIEIIALHRLRKLRKELL